MTASWLKTLKSRLNRRLRILETNYGISSGWYVEVADRRIARLTDPQYAEMFWVSYQVEPTTSDSDDLQLLYSDQFWNSEKPVYRSCEFGEIVPTALACGGPGTMVKESGRINMRALYLDANVQIQFWDQILLWCRRRTNRS
jgi:hypothetical protein